MTARAGVSAARRRTAGFECVVIARHGETEWNLEGRRQGRLDSPLTGAGRETARRVGAALAGWPVDGIFTSPLGRARETATLFGAELGLDPVVIDELAEIDHGAMSGMTNAEVEAAFPGALTARASDPYVWRYPGGESYADGDRRAARVLERVRSSGLARPVLVSHEMIGRMLLRNLLDLTPATALAMSQPHGVVYRVAFPAAALARVELGR